MADFVAVLTKTIDGLGPRNTADMRQKVYERAKKAIAEKLSAISPPPSPAQAERQYKLLDDAIKAVEDKYAPPKVIAPAVSPVQVTPVPPKPDRDPLEDFLASVQDEPVRAPLPAPKAASAAFRHSEVPAAPKAAQKPASGQSADPVLGLDGDEPPLSVPGHDYPLRKQKRSGNTGLIYGLLGLLVIGAAGYAGYLYKDALQSALGMTTAANKPAAAAKPAPAAEVAKPATPEPAKPVETAAAEPAPKFTQRLNADGTEVDAGPGTKPAEVGEGSTVAAATTPSTETPATPAEPAKPVETVAVGQKAIFYEEKTGTEAGTADQGAVVWSVVQDSPGVDQPEEPAIRGDLTIADKGIKMRLTIKRNADKSLPASHIIEMLFTTPPDFAGGAIEAVQRMALKDTEQAPGSPLVGVPAAFGDGFFLIALTDEKTAIETNMTLLQRQNWIDVPVAYRSGRRALLSFEKGLAGDKVFNEVFKAWEAKTAAPAPAPAAPAVTGG